MKCQNCGNELGQDEVFCGQCGAPNTVPAQPTEMMQKTPLPISGLPNSGYRTSAFPPNQSGPLFAPENMPSPGQSAIRQGPQQAGGFYQDATEAISMSPGTPANYPPTPYPQQGFNNGMPMQSGYNGPGQFGTQAQQPPFMTGNYSNATFPPTQMNFATGQFGQGGYGTPSGISMTAQPQKRSNVVMIVGIICLVVAIITVGTFGALFALHGGSNSQNQPTTSAQTAATPTATPSPTALPTPSPTPTIAVSPTPQPDPNFGWCVTQCTQSGFQVEFPNGWAQAATQDGQGIQFTDNTQTDIYAAFKTPSSSATSANDLLNSDINNFSSQPGYTAPQQAPQSTTIGGYSWNYQTIYYQLNGQPEQVTIYATIYQARGYVIELEAPQAEFSALNGQYFSTMLGRFQFVTPGQ